MFNLLQRKVNWNEVVVIFCSATLSSCIKCYMDEWLMTDIKDVFNVICG
jgi:hypothetical protein